MSPVIGKHAIVWDSALPPVSLCRGPVDAGIGIDAQCVQLRQEVNQVLQAAAKATHQAITISLVETRR
jgi:hypothetical protein